MLTWAGMIFSVRRTSLPSSDMSSPQMGHSRSSSLSRCSTTSTGTFSGRTSSSLLERFRRVCAATSVTFVPGGAMYASASLNVRLNWPMSSSWTFSLDTPNRFLFARRSCSKSHSFWLFNSSYSAREIVTVSVFLVSVFHSFIFLIILQI